MMPDVDEPLTIADYEATLEGHRRLVRRLDVALNGDGAAQQASLCDLVAQVESFRRKRDSINTGER
jgi:hypothetical protein